MTSNEQIIRVAEKLLLNTRTDPEERALVANLLRAKLAESVVVLGKNALLMDAPRAGVNAEWAADMGDLMELIVALTTVVRGDAYGDVGAAEAKITELAAKHP